MIDPFEPIKPKDILQNIKEIFHCPFCGANYPEDGIKVLAKFRESYIFDLICGGCGNKVTANMVYKKDGPMDIGPEQALKFDVKFQEVVSFARKGLICNDDVLNFYQSIKDFDGDFVEIFNYKRIIKKNNLN